MNAAVMCIGNLLMRDEGAGPHVAQLLMQSYVFPDNVEILDSGTMGLSLIDEFETHDLIVVVDAVDGTGEAPGTVFTFTPDQMAGHAIMHSLHDVRLTDVLAATELLGYSPDVQCVGVQVLDMNPPDFDMGLTEPVASALPLVMETVVAILARHGVDGATRVDGTSVEAGR